jgi:DNA-directed RNA polymerase specialized sigma24 family protein
LPAKKAKRVKWSAEMRAVALDLSIKGFSAGEIAEVLEVSADSAKSAMTRHRLFARPKKAARS